MIQINRLEGLQVSYQMPCAPPRMLNAHVLMSARSPRWRSCALSLNIHFVLLEVAQSTKISRPQDSLITDLAILNLAVDSCYPAS